MDRRLFLAISFGLISTFRAVAEKTWTVMPLGDSITAGGELFHSYRGLLACMLEGSDSSCASGWYPIYPEAEPHLHHEGFPGNRSNMLPQTCGGLRTDPADIIRCMRDTITGLRKIQ